MVKDEVQQAILQKVLRVNTAPFVQEQDVFRWSTDTTVMSKQTDRKYNVTISVEVHAQRRLQEQMAACLCKEDGVRFEDLMIVMMIDPRIRGHITFTGLPGGTVEQDFAKFINKASRESKDKG